MSNPPRLQEAVENLNFFEDRAERIDALISLAKQFDPVPPDVATRPYPEEHKVQGCESEVYVFARHEDGVRIYVAVENPQGMSAMAMAVLLQQSLNGSSAEEIARVDENVVYEVFGRELSMGKSMGLMGMVRMIKILAKDAAG